MRETSNVLLVRVRAHTKYLGTHIFDSVGVVVARGKYKYIHACGLLVFRIICSTY